ncbi:MAG TPA: prolyl oligopeptidase family serine peptidase [Vicinamibacterales bacterium]|nr:prolyl oligopeptidase family serine peptidase [Vicinamibacterales bacterium]
MRFSTCAAAGALASLTFVGVHAQTGQPATAAHYLLPPKTIVDILDAPPTPAVLVGPQRRTIALLSRKSLPSIADLAQPIYRIAGTRINPKTNGRQQRGGAITGITLKSIATGKDVHVVVPANPDIANVSFSPDGRHLAFTNTKPGGIELWVASTATGQSKQVSGTARLNATAGDPCDWLHHGATLVCAFVPAGRGRAPADSIVPTGPNVLENDGKAAPAPTYEDLIETRHDEDLFQYYFTSQLMTVDAATGAKTALGKPGVLENVSVSPDDRFLLVPVISRPFSHLVTMNGFPRSVEIWNRRGQRVKTIAQLPSTEGVPIAGVPTGPRSYRWRPDQPATLVWAEALDGGNTRAKAPLRDKVMTLTAPFTGEPSELAKTEWRYSNVSFTEKGIGLLTESDRATRHTRTWLLAPGEQPRKLWDRRQQDAYSDPGSPVFKMGGGGRGGGIGPILQDGDSIYLSGPGASSDGDHPFLDRLDLKTLKTDRVFRSDDKTYETFVAPLDPQAKTILTRFETPSDPPNYYVRDIAAGTKHAITAFPDPAPQLRGVHKEFVTYKRKDGVELNGTLYLPPDYEPGERLPVLMWAYPREFGDADSASQVTGSAYRFTTYNGASQLFLLTQGYAVFDNPTMPIIGPGETANDTYVEQLVASAQAAVDKLVDMGIADRDRIGIGGHSYGAFMTANLLAHSRLFRAGIARSGAYNRSLTPFGFQNERRTFWDVPQIYERMSPFWYADKVKDPILLIHGEADDNSGTFPIQSERFYRALKGFGATVRYVTLPDEAHGYAARESVLDTLAEMINWMDKYVKNAAPPTTAHGQPVKG